MTLNIAKRRIREVEYKFSKLLITESQRNGKREKD
jgi:hypothetical protein